MGVAASQPRGNPTVPRRRRSPAAPETRAKSNPRPSDIQAECAPSKGWERGKLHTRRQCGAVGQPQRHNGNKCIHCETAPRRVKRKPQCASHRAHLQAPPTHRSLARASATGNDNRHRAGPTPNKQQTTGLSAACPGAQQPRAARPPCLASRPPAAPRTERPPRTRRPAEVSKRRCMARRRCNPASPPPGESTSRAVF